MTPSEMDLTKLLQAPYSTDLISERATFDKAAFLETPFGTQVADWARSGPRELPQTTYSLYRIYQRTGSRNEFQDAYFAKREVLTRAAVASWLLDDPTYHDILNDALWSICEETSWVLPAHENWPWNIDLFVAETGADLATICYVLEDIIPDEIRVRVRSELQRRIFTTYQEHRGLYGYEKVFTNWTGVCFGSIGEAALLTDISADQRAELLAAVVTNLNAYIDKAFTDDGACTEGPGYWSYGLLHFVMCAELLREWTHGAIDLLSHDKLRLIAQYPAAMHLGNGACASFSDASHAMTLCTVVANKLSQRTNTPALTQLAAPQLTHRFAAVLREILWFTESRRDDVQPPNTTFSNAGVVRRNTEAGGKAAVLVAKAGRNDELHNHNDIGSFVLHIGQTTFLCDPGAGRYTREYFEPEHRYENLFCSSRGHSVPVIDGCAQAPGSDFFGEIIDQTDTNVRMRLEKAYPADTLLRFEREFRLAGDTVLVLQDTFESSEATEISEAFVTWCEVTIDGPRATLIGHDGNLIIETDMGSFQLQSLDDECKMNGRDGTLRRLTVTRDKVRALTALFTMTFVPS